MGKGQLTNQQSFYVAISRARDRAELVTDDASKLSDQLEKVAGERIAALDGVAKQTGYEAVLGVEPPRDLDHKSSERSAGREQTGLDSGKTDHDLDHGDGRLSGPQRDSGQEKVVEPQQKSTDFDLGM